MVNKPAWKMHILMHPWYKHFDNARTRCKPKNKYGKRGIKFLMTQADFRRLWFRDRAWELVSPSIDRINPSGNYEPENCRFIEIESNRKPKPVVQMTRNGEVVTIYNSSGQASRVFGRSSNANINKVAQKRNSNKTFLGYKWSLLEDMPKDFIEKLAKEGV